MVAWISIPKRKEAAEDKNASQKRITPVLTKQVSDTDIKNQITDTNQALVDEQLPTGMKRAVFKFAILGIIVAASWYAWEKHKANLQTPEAIAARKAADEKREADKKLREEERIREKELALINECKAIPFADGSGRCSNLEYAQKIQVALKRLNANDRTVYCRQKTRERAKFPSKVDFSWSFSETVQFYDGSLVSIVNLSGETMNGFGLMVPFSSTCKVRKKIDSDDPPVFYEFLFR